MRLSFSGRVKTNRLSLLQPVSWGSLALLLITGAGLLAFYDREKRRKLETVKQGPSVGKAAIGGAFELVNQDGKKVTDKDFKGNWNLVYFGFTFCPDICPDELKKMAEAIDQVRSHSKTLHFLRECIKSFNGRPLFDKLCCQRRVLLPACIQEIPSCELAIVKDPSSCSMSAY